MIQINNIDVAHIIITELLVILFALLDAIISHQVFKRNIPFGQIGHGIKFWIMIIAGIVLYVTDFTLFGHTLFTSWWDLLACSATYMLFFDSILNRVRRKPLFYFPEKPDSTIEKVVMTVFPVDTGGNWFVVKFLFWLFSSGLAAYIYDINI